MDELIDMLKYKVFIEYFERSDYNNTLMFIYI